MTFSSLTEGELAMTALNDNFFLPGSPAKLTLKWADGESKKLGVQNIPFSELDKLFFLNIPTMISDLDFKNFILRFGAIRSINFVQYENNPNFKFCFLRFFTKEQAIVA